jgi:hypothetical protein
VRRRDHFRSRRFLGASSLASGVARQPKVTEVAGYNEGMANFAFVEPEREYGPAPFGRHFLPAFLAGRGLAAEELGIVLGAATVVRYSSPIAGRIAPRRLMP